MDVAVMQALFFIVKFGTGQVGADDFDRKFHTSESEN
jgi:hypothetical protein